MLTEELLTEWTGFQGNYLSEFYIEFRKKNSIDFENLSMIKQSILEFLKIYNKTKFQEKIKFFETLH